MYHLVNWKSICRSTKSGGLGIKPLQLKKKALLAKWLWRLGKELDSLWLQVVLLSTASLEEDGTMTDPLVDSQGCGKV